MKNLFFITILAVIILGPTSTNAQDFYLNPTPFVFPSPSPLPPLDLDNPISLNFFAFFDVNRILCQALGSINLAAFGCISDSTRVTSVEDFDPELTDEELVLVREAGNEQVYEIIRGLRYAVSEEAFNDRGFDGGQVVEISSTQLSQYPRADLLRVGGTNKTFYLTESGMLRYIPNTMVFNSYGNKESNIIDISDKEFNLYPQNEFIFLADDLNRTIFKIENGQKRFISQEAFIRLNIQENQLAPINRTEFDFYPTGEPIL